MALPACRILSSLTLGLWVVNLAFVTCVRAESLTDNFDVTASDPGDANDFNLNVQLDVRQGGDLAPAMYTRISGGNNLVQVSNSTPDNYGAESGLGKMDFFNLDFSAVQLDVVPDGHAVKVDLEATPVANNAALDSQDWLCVNVGATGGGGFVNAGTSGVGMLIRDNGGYQVFNNGPLIADGSVAAAATYLLEISLNSTRDQYSLSINGQLVVDAMPVTVTGKLIQFGGIGGAPAGQPFNMHLVDNLAITTEPAPVFPCFTASRAFGAGPLAVDFDASCSIIQGTVSSIDWDFGDGAHATGKQVSHTFNPGDSTVTLVVSDTSGNSAEASTLIRVFDAVTSYADDFERPDGPPDGWTVSSGNWRLEGGKLRTTNPTTEQFIYAGSPAVSLPRYVTYTYDYQFLSPATASGVGRHGGFMFANDLPLDRGNTAMTGYFVDWIDRAADRGIRLSRIDKGALVLLVGGLEPGLPADPPLTWKVEIEDEHIRVFGDGVQYIDHVDSRYRGGLFGFWTYIAQDVAIDNVAVASRPTTACFISSPIFPLFPDSTVHFDAGCSEAVGGSLTTFQWDFGDGGAGAGATIDHHYAAIGTYDVTLTVTRDAGGTDTVTEPVTINQNLMPFLDCFDRPAGPVDGWTPATGAWNITDQETLETITAGVESFAWMGSPPRPVGADFAMEFTYQFDATPADGVGRHGGIMFYALRPTDRYDPSMNGYTIDWIDRAGDHGFRLIRVDGGVQTPLAIGTPGIAQPPSRWKVAIQGDHIILSADGAPVFDVIDNTYRLGYVGFWTFSNGNHIEIDNVSAPPGPPVGCAMDMSCSVAVKDVPTLSLSATPILDGCPVCHCDSVDVLVDGEPVGTFTPAQVLDATVPLPGSCTPGTSHQLGVRCTGGDSITSCSFVCPTPPLEAPTGLQVTGHKGEVDLAWTRVTDASATGYNVYRAEGAGAFSKITASPLAADASTHVDTAVTVGLTYSYQVHAVYAAGESGPSNTATATVEPKPTGGTFRRGDVDGSGVVELTDVINLLGFLFLGDPPGIECFDAADVDDTGIVELTDAIVELGWLFLGDPLSLPDPGPFACGPDADASDTLAECSRACQ